MTHSSYLISLHYVLSKICDEVTELIDKIGAKNGKLLIKKLIRHLLKVKSIQVKV